LTTHAGTSLHATNQLVNTLLTHHPCCRLSRLSHSQEKLKLAVFVSGQTERRWVSFDGTSSASSRTRSQSLLLQRKLRLTHSGLLQCAQQAKAIGFSCFSTRA
jgi:hypothetical protein